MRPYHLYLLDKLYPNLTHFVLSYHVRLGWLIAAIVLLNCFALKGLAMIFAGQKTQFIILRGKEIHYIFQNK